jgi:hypothetical protein
MLATRVALQGPFFMVTGVCWGHPACCADKCGRLLATCVLCLAPAMYILC